MLSPMSSKTYRDGQKAGTKYQRENFSYRMATGKDLPRPNSPFNGEELSKEWEAGFNSKAGK
jgi:hypothetical protein